MLLVYLFKYSDIFGKVFSVILWNVINCSVFSLFIVICGRFNVIN